MKAIFYPPTACKFTLTTTLPNGETHQVAITQKALIKAIESAGRFQVLKTPEERINDEVNKRNILNRQLNGL